MNNSYNQVMIYQGEISKSREGTIEKPSDDYSKHSLQSDWLAYIYMLRIRRGRLVKISRKSFKLQIKIEARNFWKSMKHAIKGI